MSACSVQINFELLVPVSQYLSLAESKVPVMRELSGFVWKLWLLSDDGRRAGGLYLFRDRRSAEQYANGPEVSHLKHSPALRQVEVRVTPVHEGLSAQTAGAIFGEVTPC